MEEQVIAQGWWVPILGTVATAIATVVGSYLTKLLRSMTANMKLNDANKEALESLLEGMAKAQDDLARDMKKAAADGKLSKEEISKLQSYAWNHAKGAATGPAKDIVVNWSADKVSSLIKQLLAKYTVPKK
jgi:hypothetical protein